MAAARRRLCASTRSRTCACRCRPPRRAADGGGDDPWSMTTMRRSSPSQRSSISTSGQSERGERERAVEVLAVGHADGDARALLAAGRLDHHRADLVAGSRGRRRSKVASRPRGTRQAGVGEIRRVTRLSSQRLIATAVVSSDSDSRVTTLLPPCVSRSSPPLRVEHLDRDAAPQRLVGDDPGVRVELVEPLGLRRHEQPLVDGVLALDAEHRAPARSPASRRARWRRRCRA